MTTAPEPRFRLYGWSGEGWDQLTPELPVGAAPEAIRRHGEEWEWLQVVLVLPDGSTRKMPPRRGRH